MEPLHYGYCKNEAEDENKDCPCKCDKKEDKKWLQCLSGKYNGKEEKITVLNMCQYNCWKCRFDYMEPLHYGYCKNEAEDENKDCPCKCDKKEDKKWLQCLSGKYNGKEEKRTVLNMCQYYCWKCRFNYMKPLYYGYCKKEESPYDQCLNQLNCWSDMYDSFCMRMPFDAPKTVDNICYAYCATKHLDAKFESKGECSHSKDCKCKCGDKKDMKETCVKGKWDGKEEKVIVSNWCMYDCWKCRMQGILQTC